MFDGKVNRSGNDLRTVEANIQGNIIAYGTTLYRRNYIDTYQMLQDNIKALRHITVEVNIQRKGHYRTYENTSVHYMEETRNISDDMGQCRSTATI